MNDRELLELAAKACGYEHYRYCTAHMALVPEPEGEDVLPFSVWNPLTDDGDALRLAIELRLDISFLEGFEEITVEDYHCSHRAREDYKSDMAAATRRVIVRTAAEIGRSMP